MGAPPKFEIHDELESGTGRLTPVGELDMATVPQLERAARGLLDRHASELLIDLSQVSFMDSSGLRSLIMLHDDACEEGWTLRLLRPAKAPQELFRLTGLEDHLPVVKEPTAP
jgi:anti-anti-sigma factor